MSLLACTDKLGLFLKPPSVLPSFCFVLVEEDTEGSSRSGRESMSTSGDLIAGPGVNGYLSIDDSQKDRDKTGSKEKKTEREKDKERDKDKNKAKKGVLKGLGDMFRYVTTPLPCCLKYQCLPALFNSTQLIHQRIIQNLNAALIRDHSPWTLWGGGSWWGWGCRPQGPLALLSQIIFNKNSMFYS